MKILDYYRVRKLLRYEKYLNKLINNNLLNFSHYSVGVTSTDSVRDIYEIRLERYLDGEITNKHNGLKEFVKNISKDNIKEIKIHSFDNQISNISYTIFTDVKIKNIIGIIESYKT